MADQTVSTNYEPWLQIPYQWLVNSALGQAQQQYQPYTGQGVAPMTPMQQQAINAVGGYSTLPNAEGFMGYTQQAAQASGLGAAAPYIGASSNYLGAATTAPGAVGSATPLMNAGTNYLAQAGSSPTAASAANPYLGASSSALTQTMDISGRGAANPYALMATSSPGALQAANPYLQQASQSGVGGISSYLNPYNTAVNDALAQQAGRNLSENLLPGVNKTFTSAGQFGSSRNADFTGRAIRDTQESLLNQQSQNLQSGFNTAAGLAQQDLARQAGLASTAGGLQAQDLNRYLGAGQLALSGAQTDINRNLGVAGQENSMAQIAGSNATNDASRYLNIGNAYGNFGNMAANNANVDRGALMQLASQQAGLGQLAGGLTGVDAQRLLAAGAQGTNQAIAGQNLYNQGVDRYYGYGAAQQGQNQNENAWNYSQWQQQQQYPWSQLNNLSAILGGARPGGTVQSTNGGGGSNLNSAIGAGLGLIAARPWTWFKDGGSVPRYAEGGLTGALDNIADTFDSPLMQAALSLAGSKGSPGSALGSAVQAAAKATTNADMKKIRKMQMDLLKAKIPTPAAPVQSGGALSAAGSRVAGGSGIMQGTRPYWDEYEAVGYADGGGVDDEDMGGGGLSLLGGAGADDEGGILSAFTKAGNWLDRVTGGGGIEAGPLDKRYADLVGGKLPERPAINSPLMQAAAALLTSKQKRPLAAIGEGLSALTQGSENQRRLALGEQAMKAQILGALQKEQKAPETVEAFDPASGQKVRMMYNRTTGKYDQPIGGVEQKRGDMPWWVMGNPKEGVDIAPGALQAMTGVKGAEAAAEAWAKLPVEERMARLKSSLHIGEQNAAPFTLGPGDVRYGGGRGGAGMPSGAPPMPGGAPPSQPGAPASAAAPQTGGGQPPPPQGAPPPTGGALPQRSGLPPGAVAASPYPPQAMVNVDMNGRPAFEQEYGKEEAKQAASLLDAANNASKTMDNYRAFLALQDQVKTGRAAPTMKEIAGWAESLGIDPQRLGLDKAGPAEAMNSIGRSLTMSLIGAGGFPANNFSDADRKFLEQVKPSLSNTEPGNRMIADLQMRMLQRTIDQASAWRDAREQGKTWQQFQQDWSKYKNANPVFDQDFKEQVRAVSNKPGRAEYPYAPVISERKPGQIYHTPNGPLMWTGKKGAEWQAIQ